MRNYGILSHNTEKTSKLAINLLIYVPKTTGKKVYFQWGVSFHLLTSQPETSQNLMANAGFVCDKSCHGLISNKSNSLETHLI
jgi:hypothetical protein